MWLVRAAGRVIFLLQESEAQRFSQQAVTTQQAAQLPFTALSRSSDRDKVESSIPQEESVLKALWMQSTGGAWFLKAKSSVDIVTAQQSTGGGTPC